jgi:aldehyde dehydrogenase (NAD+)
MSLADDIRVPLRNADRFFIGGEWVTPSSDAKIDVIDSGTEELFFRVAEAQAADISRAVGAARQAFDEGPWPRLTHARRAEYLTAIAAGLRERNAELGQIWPRESGVLHAIAQFTGTGAARTFDSFAALAGTLAEEEPATPTGGGAARRRPGAGSRRCAASGSPAARSSSAASRPPSSSTTWTSARPPRRWPGPSASCPARCARP